MVFKPSFPSIYPSKQWSFGSKMKWWHSCYPSRVRCKRRSAKADSKTPWCDWPTAIETFRRRSFTEPSTVSKPWAFPWKEPHMPKKKKVQALSTKFVPRSQQRRAKKVHSAPHEKPLALLAPLMQNQNARNKRVRKSKHSSNNNTNNRKP